jgi:hypothetical protein
VLTYIDYFDIARNHPDLLTKTSRNAAMEAINKMDARDMEALRLLNDQIKRDREVTNQSVLKSLRLKAGINDEQPTSPNGTKFARGRSLKSAGFGAMMGRNLQSSRNLLIGKEPEDWFEKLVAAANQDSNRTTSLSPTSEKTSSMQFGKSEKTNSGQSWSKVKRINQLATENKFVEKIKEKGKELVNEESTGEEKKGARVSGTSNGESSLGPPASALTGSARVYPTNL